MKLFSSRRREFSVLLGTSPLWVYAQEAPDKYPSKPIRLIVPNGASSSTDTNARLFAKEASVALGQPFVIENKAGAAGNIGSEYVARSAPDGYTVLYGFNSIPTISPHIYKKLTYDFNADLMPVTQLYVGSYVLAVNNSLPIKNFEDFVDFAKKNPGVISYGTDGTGTVSNLCGEMISSTLGIKLTHIPYKETPVVDLISGNLQALIGPLTTIQEYVRRGQMRGILSTRTTPIPALPQVQLLPTFLPGVSVAGWQAIFVPKNTPSAIISRLQMAFKHALNSPEVVARIKMVDGEGVGGTPQQLTEIISRENRQWRDLILKIGLKID